MISMVKMPLLPSQCNLNSRVFDFTLLENYIYLIITANTSVLLQEICINICLFILTFTNVFVCDVVTSSSNFLLILLTDSYYSIIVQIGSSRQLNQLLMQALMVA